MQKLIFEIDNKDDLTLLLSLTKRLGIKQEIETPKDSETETKDNKLIAHYLKIIQKGGDTSYIDDPVEWQKKVRKDRNLPFEKL